MKYVKLSALALASALFVTACGSGAGNNDNSDSAGLGEQIENAIQGNPDQDFVKDAIESNTKELAWLRAGESMGTDAELVKHAKMMLADHEQLGVTMKDYAASKGYEVMPPDTQNEVDINKDKGRDWDKAWADKMLDDHEKDIRKFEKAQGDVKDEQLKTIITEALPKLRSHLDMVKPLKEKLDK